MSDTLILNLDGAVLKTKEELHSKIQWQLNLPDYYGRNLDALWDVLSTWNKPLCIEVTHIAELQNYLGDYADALFQLLNDVVQENTAVTLQIFPE